MMNRRHLAVDLANDASEEEGFPREQDLGMLDETTQFPAIVFHPRITEVDRSFEYSTLHMLKISL
jgi:hypothetical protein